MSAVRHVQKNLGGSTGFTLRWRLRIEEKHWLSAQKEVQILSAKAVTLAVLILLTFPPAVCQAQSPSPQAQQVRTFT